jgi:membrane protein
MLDRGGRAYGHAVSRPLPQRGRAVRTLAWSSWERFERSFAGMFLAELLEMRAVDRALALASKCFIAILPLSILSNAVVSGRAFGDELVRRFGLTGSGAAAARELFATPSQVEAGIGILGFVILVTSALSFARALERVYLEAWDLQTPTGMGAARTRLLWLVSLFLAMSVLSLSHADPADTKSRIVSAVGGGVFFVWTPYVLLGGRVAWGRLVPTAAFSGVAVLALGIGSAIVMPELVTRNTARYGLVGLAFSLVSWLFTAALLIIAAAVFGALVDRRRAGR